MNKGSVNTDSQTLPCLYSFKFTHLLFLIHTATHALIHPSFLPSAYSLRSLGSLYFHWMQSKMSFSLSTSRGSPAIPEKQQHAVTVETMLVHEDGSVTVATASKNRHRSLDGSAECIIQESVLWDWNQCGARTVTTVGLCSIQKLVESKRFIGWALIKCCFSNNLIPVEKHIIFKAIKITSYTW